MLAGSIFSFFVFMSSYVVGMVVSSWEEELLIANQFKYGYCVRISFQAPKGSTAVLSGVQYLAQAIPQILGVVLSGALVTVLGVYVRSLGPSAMEGTCY
jgi:hypothetical protein